MIKLSAKGSPEELFHHRQRAIALLAQGLDKGEVARRVGVTRRSPAPFTNRSGVCLIIDFSRFSRQCIVFGITITMTMTSTMTSTSTKETNRRDLSDRVWRIILGLGIVLRVAVYLTLGVMNNDDHLVVIRHIAREGALPAPGQYVQAYHPPLYHLLGAAIVRAGGGPKAVQALSLAFSMGMFLLAARLLRRLPWLAPRAQPWLLALVALHPQLIVYSMFISNDTLAIFLGMLVFWAPC